MWRVISGGLRLTLVTWVLCGIGYPLLVNVLAQLLFPYQANGSLIHDAKGAVLGSTLIGQDWQGDTWFHGRPSATTATDPQDATKTVASPYNAGSSTGSNYGPGTSALHDRILADRQALEKQQPELHGVVLPADMLTTSASGLDPDISVANAMLQVPRVAAKRGVSQDQLNRLIAGLVTPPAMGIFGEPRVNVLALNLALAGQAK